MLEKISQADMEEGEGQDLATTVLTCEGDLRDPGFPGRLRSLVLRLRELISDEEQPLWVKKVEPWNSVRVTFTLPRDAALRLRQLAQRGDRALRELGILSVQVEGDQIISLTLAGRYGEPPKEIIIQKAAEEGEQGSPTSPHMSGVPSSPALAAAASSRAGSSTALPAEPPSIQARSPAFAAAAAASTSGSGSAFRSPNVVAPPPREPLPFLSSGSSRLVRPSTKTRPPFPFASMTHSMKQNSAAAAAATTTSGSRFPFSPSPPLAAALGAAQRLGSATRGNVALSSPLLVNLLQSETGSGGPQKTMMPPPLDTGQPTKRKRRPPKGSRGKEGCSPPGSPSSPPPTSPSCDAINILSGRGFPLSSHIPASPPRMAPPTATVSVAPPSPPAAAESRTTTHLINPFTGHLEPMPSDEEDDEPVVRDLETSESSENGGHSERSLSDGSSGGKDPGNPSSDTDSGIGKSSSSQSSNDPEPPPREEVSRVSLPPTEGEKLKLRLKLDSKRSCPVKPEVEASPPPSPQGEPPRVPPLHISLRGPNVAVVVSPRKPEAAPKKRSPRSPRSSNSAESSGGGDARRACRGARARGDKAAERMRELSLLSGGGIVRVPVSMSPTVVLTPLQLQHPLGAGGTRRTLPSPSSSSSSPSSSSPSSASPSSCAQSTKPHWSATSLGPEADSSVSDGSSPLRDRPDLPHALRSADHDTGAVTPATTMTTTTVTAPPRQAGNGEPAANSALGALECHTTPHRTALRPRSVPTPETNGVLHTDEEEQRSPSPCRASPSSLAKMTMATTTSAIEKKPLANCLEGPITNHVGSTKGDGVDELREMAERRLSPTPMARIISLDAVAAKKTAFGGPVFEVSDVDVPAALKLGGLVGGNHRMPLLIPTGGGGGGATFRGDVVLRQEYATTHHPHHHHFHCTTANSVLKPGIVRMNRLRFGAGFAAATAAVAAAAAATTQARVETTASVAVKSNGIASSPLQNECDSTIDAESSLDSDDLISNGPSSTTPVSLVAASSLSASATPQTLSAASAIVSRSDGFSELPMSRGRCDSATNGSADFVAAVSSDNGVTTTGRAEENGVSPDSNHELLPRDPLGPSDTDGDKSGDDEEASSALSEERGSSISPPSEDPCSNIPPDRPSSAPLPPAAPSPLPPPPSSSPETTAVVVASSQSMATPSEAAAPSSLSAGALVASSISSSSSSTPSSSCSSPTTWGSTRPTSANAAEAMPRMQPSPSEPASGVAEVPSSTLQVPGGQMISPSMWSTAGSSGTSSDPQQRLTFIFKGNLTAATTASSSSPTSCHPVLALPAGPSSIPKTVPIKLLALPSGTSGLALKSSLAELISSPASQNGSRSSVASGSVSPPIRLVVSKIPPTVKGASLGSPAATGGTARAVQPPAAPPSSTSSPSLVNMVMKSVMATASATTVVAQSPLETSAEASPSSVLSSTASFEPSVNVPALMLPEERQPVVSGVSEVRGEVPVEPDSQEAAACAMAATSSVVVTEADTGGADASAEVMVGVSEAVGKGECGGAEKSQLSAGMERLSSPTLLPGDCTDMAEDSGSELAVLSPTVIANHIGSPQLPDSLSTLLDMAIDPPDDDDESEPASNRASPVPVSLLLTNHKDSEEEPVPEHEADLELLRTCPEASVCAPGDELGDDGRLRNQRRRAAQVPSPATVEEGESDHSSEEEMSLSELAHKSRVRPPRPQRHGKENEALATAAAAAADSPAPTTRREDGGPGRPRRLTAAGSGEAKAARSRLGQQQAMASQQSQALSSPSPMAAVASLPAEEALRRNADRSRRSPATMPAGRDHRSPPRLPNQRNFRRDSEVRDDDAVVVMKRKTRASGPSTDPQQEAAAPNKRRRYSKDSHR
ncbi:pneumococcal serine-rich repeat protein-like isoform X1 [Dermacentor albipictus]|uniref:pneumococcal serine-rich repeat protein-like isoform X1 n=2 Tax=Dermacentor albipictus TaxID=60249 RepID=UPI0038FCC70B